MNKKTKLMLYLLSPIIALMIIIIIGIVLNLLVFFPFVYYFNPKDNIIIFGFIISNIFFWFLVLFIIGSIMEQ